MAARISSKFRSAIVSTSSVPSLPPQSPIVSPHLRVHRRRKPAPRKVTAQPGTDQRKPEKKIRRKDCGIPEATNSQLLATPEGKQQFSRLHADVLGLCALFDVAGKILDPETFRTLFGLSEGEHLSLIADALAHFVEQMKPRDALEKLAVEQLLLTHVRVLRLSQQASKQSSPDMIKILNDAVDGASGTFRRLMTAFRDCRKPPREQAVVAIRQGNVGEQQINLGDPMGEKRNGERTRNRNDEKPSAPKTLPSDPEGS
jgi:hypothetical protein